MWIKIVGFSIILVIFITSCSAGKHTNSSLPTDVFTGTEEVIRIISTNGFFDRYSGYHIVGEIINNSGSPVKSIQLGLTITDGSGVSLLRTDMGETVDFVPFTSSFEYLDAGERSPFTYYFDTSFGIPANYQIFVMKYEPAAVLRGEWKEENIQILDNGEGYYILTGEIVNLSSQWQTIKTLAGGVRDDTGKVLSVETIGTHVSLLSPAGDSSGQDRTPFIIRIPIPSEAVTQWDIWCETEYRSELTSIPLVVEQTNLYMDEFNTAHLVAAIRNISDTPISSPVVASLYNEDLLVLDVSYMLPVVPIPPGMVLPFDITNFYNLNQIIMDISDIAAFQVFVDFDNIKSDFNVIEIPAENEITEKFDNHWIVVGNFTNNTPYDLSLVTILTSIYSVDNALVGVGYTYSYADDGLFSAGDIGSYEVLIYLPMNMPVLGFFSRTIVIASISE